MARPRLDSSEDAVVISSPLESSADSVRVLDFRREDSRSRSWTSSRSGLCGRSTLSRKTSRASKWARSGISSRSRGSSPQRGLSSNRGKPSRKRRLAVTPESNGFPRQLWTSPRNELNLHGNVVNLWRRCRLLADEIRARQLVPKRCQPTRHARPCGVRSWRRAG